MSRILSILFFLIFCICHTASAQYAFIDSIRIACREKPVFHLGFHNRNTFLNSDQVKLYGLVAGFRYNKKVDFYIGLYGFNNANRKQLIGDERFPDDTINRATGIENFSVGIEYTYYQVGRWSLSIPVQIGLGSFYYDYYHRREKIMREQYSLVPLEFGSNAHYRILSWLGLKAEAGYRLSLGRKEVFRHSSPYYSFGLSLAAGVLYREIKSNMSD